MLLVGQVCIRWIYEQGTMMAVKSFNWELGKDDYERIGRIPQKKMMLNEELVSPKGPYKSVEELRDGEL